MSKKRLASSSSSSSSKKKKKSSSTATNLFSAIDRLNTQDVDAAKTHSKQSKSSIQQSKAARIQANLNSDLIECRILLQRAIGHADQHGDKEEKASSGSNSSAVDLLLENLLEARRKLCIQPLPKIPIGSDEEDDSDDDDDDVNYKKIIKQQNQNDTNINDDDELLEQTIQIEYDANVNRWKKVLNKRHADLKLHSGMTAKTASKFKVLDQNFWDQVSSTVDHQRIMMSSAGNENGDDDEEEKDEYTFPFNDSKVYQHMLRDFIATGAASSKNNDNNSSSATDAATDATARLKRAMSKKNKNANSKEVDRRASKGRKIRYVVHPKLQNFTFPMARLQQPAIEEDDWFRSLFGGAAKNGKK